MKENTTTWSEIRKWSSIAILTISSMVLCSNVAKAAVIKTDIVMIVDESGSMGGVQANLRNNIGLFASILSAGGIDANYALVGYGRSGDLIRLITDFTDASGFATAAANLVASGGTEPAYDATAYALNSLSSESGNLTYRADAVKNMIVYTDENSNGDTEYNEATLDALLKSNNSLFNAVVPSTAYTSLINLATNNGGQFFNLNFLNTNDQSIVEEFVENFARAKLQETLDFCQLNPNDPACTNVSVPAPASAYLLLLAVAAISTRRLAKSKNQI